jgi:hypothetical protein
MNRPKSFGNLDGCPAHSRELQPRRIPTRCWSIDLLGLIPARGFNRSTDFILFGRQIRHLSVSTAAFSILEQSDGYGSLEARRRFDFPPSARALLTEETGVATDFNGRGIAGIPCRSLSAD